MKVGHLIARFLTREGRPRISLDSTERTTLEDHPVEVTY